MRVTSFALGILGGAAGLGVHAVLLVSFFSQPSGAFQVFLQLALATVLGLAAILVAALLRRSTKMLAVLLPVLGVLGFFPRPMSWAPAGVLLVAGGLVAALSLRSDVPSHAPSRAVVSATGSPLHWSEAARLGVPTVPSRPVATRRGESWSTTRRAVVVGAVVVAAAIVIPLSLLSPWDPGAGSEGAQQIAEDSSPTTTAQTPSTVDLTQQAGGPATTTTASSTTTTVAATPGALDTYNDSLRGFAMSYPTAWRNTDPGEVGERVFGSQERLLAEEYTDTYVAAAFADWNGPTFNGCYLDYVWVEVWDDGRYDSSYLPEIQAAFETWLDEVIYEYPEADIQVIEWAHETQIGGATGFEQVWQYFLGGYTMVIRECGFIADQTFYHLRLATIEENQDANGPLFDQILEDFQVFLSSDVL